MYLKWEQIILGDFLLHTITDEREIKILFELLEKRNEQRKSTIASAGKAWNSLFHLILLAKKEKQAKEKRICRSAGKAWNSLFHLVSFC